MKILIVEDSNFDRTLLTDTLASFGYTKVVSVPSAQGAFEILGMNKPRIEPTDIQLVLMDVVMEGSDGIEACRKIKEYEVFKNLPIIMVTSSTDPMILERAFDAGAWDFLTKPLKKVELLSRLRAAYNIKREMDYRLAREWQLLTLTKQLKEANQNLQSLSSLDGLTGVANRRSFDEILNMEWKRAARDNKPLSLIMIDVDLFKNYNDTYGHQAGDLCLKQVAQALRSVLSRPGDFVARYGGEEFTVILPGTPVNGAKAVAEAMRAKVEELAVPHETSPEQRVTISLGVAGCDLAEGPSAESLVEKADQSLYEAKRQGRNRVTASREMEQVI